MAEQKHKSQAQKAVAKSGTSRSKASKTGNTTQKKTSNDLKSQGYNVPVRLISSIVFLSLFIIFLILFIEPEGKLLIGFGNFIHGLIGNAGFMIAIPAFLYLFIIHAFSGKKPIKMRTICLLSFVGIVGCISHLFLQPQLSKGFSLVGELYTSGVVNHSGGVICGLIAHLFKEAIGTTLSFIVFFVAAALTLLGSVQITIPAIIRAIKERPRADWEDDPVEDKPEPASIVVNHIANKRIEHIERKRKEAEERKLAEEQAELDRANNADAIMSQIGSDVEAPVAAAANTITEPNEDEILTAPTVKSKTTAKTVAINVSPVTEDVENEHQTGSDDLFEELPSSKSEAELVPVSEEPLPEIKTVKPDKVTSKDAAASALEVAKEIAEAESQEKPEYCYPPIDLLKLPGKNSSDGTAEMRENSRRLNETLASFKIEAHIINVTRGPSVTRYEVELEKGVRLSKLTTAADDIALSLGASGVRIAAVPGKISVVGIEVPNKAVTTVSLREVIDSSEFNNAKSMSSFAVGKDIGGNCIVGNIAKLPHMLIAGTTGSGKSVCMNSIIISLLYKASPDDVKLIMVDPKMVELGIYNGIPHLLIPVVTDPKKAAGSLQWAVTEMMRRYKAMSDAGVRDLESYNSIMISENEPEKKLPQVVVIIDELADLMLVAAKEVEESICRIAQMGRASGIHLIIATQRPSADVITGLMKANIPSRIAFAVASAMESRIILDTQGAEKLVGRGDMLYAPIGNGKPRRVQGCFVSDPEVEAVATYVKSNFVSDYDQQIMDEIEKKAAQTGNKAAAATAADPDPNCEELDGDEMLPAAVDVILETGQASVSMLQRRLKLGYARAARIVDEMEEKGIVGPFQGSKPRSILVTKEQWAAMKSGNNTQMDFDDLEEDGAVPEDF